MAQPIQVYLKENGLKSFTVCEDEERLLRIGRIIKPFSYDTLNPYVAHLYQISMDFNDVRDKFRYHETLEDAIKAITDRLNGLDEKPDDSEVIFEGVKLWEYDEYWFASTAKYIGSKEQYALFYAPFKNKRTYCLGGSISHGCDVAGYTEAAIYLTSCNQTREGYVIRIGFELGEPRSRVKIEDAPKGLFIRR